MIGRADNHPESDRPKGETYDLVDESLPAPPLPGAAVVAPSAYDAIDLVAADLVAQAINCVRQFGDFHLALCGGLTPQPLYERLMFDADYRALPWQRTHLWLVDELAVPWDDPRSHYRLIDETIVQHADIPAEQVHPILATAEDGDRQYEAQLREALEWREKGQDRLDFVLLGVGSDGSTAGLSPGVAALSIEDQLMAATPAASDAVEGPDRITMTLPLINAARFVAVMAIGESKAEIIRTLAHDPAPVGAAPIRGVMPHGGELKWFLDADAASLAV